VERDHEVPRSDRLAESALSAEVLTKALRKIQSKRLLVVIDSCHTAGMASSKEVEWEYSRFGNPRDNLNLFYTS